MLRDLPGNWEQGHPNPSYLAVSRQFAMLTNDYDVYVGPQRLALGIYLAHFNFDHEIEHLIQESYPFSARWKVYWDKPDYVPGSIPYDLPDDFGVCDDYTQILAKWPELESDPAHFIVALSLVRKADQESEGGWRWHKWGPYIGTKNPQHEYLYDEEDIEEVFCFHIIELKGSDGVQ